jgi:YHS domain-containing protein
MKTIQVALLIMISLTYVFGQVDPVDKQGLAIGGYDLISYFKINKAIKGNPQINASFKGATYYFISEENRNEFQSDPEKYLPQYEGYCALAVGTTGKKISINPETFKVTDGKLYLFFNGKSFSGTTFNSVDPWIKNESTLIKKADDMWPTVKTKKYKYEN